MTAYRLNGRLARLEAQMVVEVDYTRMPAALRQARIVELIIRLGVEPGKVEATLAELRAMTPAERLPWIRARSTRLKE